MSDSPFRLALAPLAARFPRVVREHEILRVAGQIDRHGSAQLEESVRKHVLAWVQNRSGGRLPAEAWNGGSFEYLVGGRNSIGIRLRDSEADVWAVRADDPDKDIPDRVWTTEIAIGAEGGGPLQFGARLLVSTTEGYPDIEPHVPGFVIQIAERHDLFRGSYRIEPEPWYIHNRPGAEELMEMLIDPERKLPLYVVTCPDGTNEPAWDTTTLARALTGIGRVVVLPAEFTWVMTERFGKFLSVFGGAVRAYLPGFDAGCRPFDHKLFLASALNDQSDIKRCERWIRIHAAAESCRNLKIDQDILSFGKIRSESFQRNGTELRDEGASDSQRLLVAQKHIESLTEQLLKAENYQEHFSNEAGLSEERARAAENQLRSAVFRIQQLEEIRSAELKDQAPDDDLPIKWDAFANWCDVRLAGRVTLVPSARRSTKSPDFEDSAQAARCLIWLGSVCRDSRIGNVVGSLRDEPVEPGIYNSPCGNDSFEFDWQGQRLLATWHIKNGGNTREPRRCLRIYYGWDADTRQIVIAEMPAHRRTGAS